ncbi:transmembrane protein [Heterostelium album PN500]|uniref:Transmembrane protein n=1 Tax=Heterostelium pallidum (strain ATCC 26659 / Pp 5 / PN500) TaxID=670386 RepID=D3B9F7_HETP5|nr:transmembrane protein [Heterostelium album PN500]EFA81869.1 transmembrane protein [Heterostelium album PN500]|eukprot:XP_020433986.1 transmembrane protein [Heterostelium album PN500]
MIALLILTCAPASGAHLNPTITLTTLLCGYTPLSKSLVYFIAQFAGGIVGAGLLRGIVPPIIENRTHLAACDFAYDITIGRALCAEFILSFVNIFVTFFTALDPRQYPVIGPVVSAFLISGTVGLTQILAGGYAYTYSGPGYNMSRCLGPAVISGYWHRLWVFFVAQILASIFVAVILLFNPPFKTISNKGESEELDDVWESGPYGTKIHIHKKNHIDQTEYV